MSESKNVALERVSSNPANVESKASLMGANALMAAVRFNGESLIKTNGPAQKVYQKAFAETGFSTCGNGGIDSVVGALVDTFHNETKNKVRLAALLGYIDENEIYKRFRDTNGDAFKNLKAFLTSGKMAEITGGDGAYTTLSALANVGKCFYLPMYAGDKRYDVFADISPRKLSEFVQVMNSEKYKQGFLDAVFSQKKFALVGKTLSDMTTADAHKVALSMSEKSKPRKTGQSRNPSTSETPKADADAPKAETPKAEMPETPKAEMPETPKAETPETPKAETPETPKAETPETPKADADVSKAETPKADEMPDYVRFDIIANDGTRKSFYYLGFASEFNDWASECGVMLYQNGLVWAMFLENADGTHTRAFVAETVPLKHLDNALDLIKTRKAADMRVVHAAFKEFVKSL